MTIQRHIPKGYTALQLQDLPENCEVYWEPEKLVAIAFGGRRSKPDWHFRFRTEAALKNKIQEWVDASKKRAEHAAKRQAERYAPHDVKPGDIFVSHWGWEQSNVDYYEVISLRGARQIVVRRIGAKSVERLSMQGECVPVPGKYIAEPVIKTVYMYSGTPSFKAYSFANAQRKNPIHVIDGVKIFAPDSWTSYA